MTAKATKTRKTAPAAPATGEAEFRRWTPQEVVDRQLLPYSSARMIREKCYRRELFYHRDGGRITFTAEDLRRNSELGACEPFAAPAA